jgi:predicted RNA-binding Zn ribbon-like protein
MFGHDAEHALLVAVDLVNTAPATRGEEGLPDVAALAELVRRGEVSGVGVLTARDLTEVRRLRSDLLAVFAVADQPDRAAALVNRVVAGGRSTPWLTNHDGRHWHVHYFAPDATLAEHLAGDCGMAIAQVIADGELDRLRRCEADNCDHVLVDLSRNRSKRYCDSRRCGNRTHVAAYRERRRAAASA